MKKLSLTIEMIGLICASMVEYPTLIVNVLPDSFARGGMIQFQLVEKRIRFSVNLMPSIIEMPSIFDISP